MDKQNTSCGYFKRNLARFIDGSLKEYE